MKKKIKIWFDGMDGNFRPEDNFILNVLKKRYIVELNENPDVVFISVKTKNPYKYNCVRIFYTAENLVPRSRRQQYRTWARRPHYLK